MSGGAVVIIIDSLSPDVNLRNDSTQAQNFIVRNESKVSIQVSMGGKACTAVEPNDSITGTVASGATLEIV